MCFQIDTLCDPTFLSKAFGQVIDSFRVDPEIQISYPRAGPDLNSFPARNNCKLQIVNVTILQSFKLDIDITSRFVYLLNFETATVNVTLTWLVGTDDLFQVRKCLLLIVSLGPGLSGDEMFGLIFRIVRRAEAIGSRTTLLQASVLFSRNVDALGNSQILRLRTATLGPVVVLVTDLVRKCIRVIRSSHEDGRDRDGTGEN